MDNPEIQFVSNEAGERTAVIVPISRWNEISSEQETAHLLNSAVMRKRLLAAKERTSGIRLNEALTKLGL